MAPGFGCQASRDGCCVLCDGNGKILSPVCVCVCSFRRRDEPAVGSSEPCFFFFHVAVALFVAYRYACRACSCRKSSLFFYPLPRSSRKGHDYFSDSICHKYALTTTAPHHSKRHHRGDFFTRVTHMNLRKWIKSCYRCRFFWLLLLLLL